jgi:molybdopterin converting factor small subunit
VQVKVRLFAQMRLAAAAGEIDLEVPEGATLGRALELFYERHPVLGPHAGSCLTAVGLDYAPPDRVLSAGEEICLIPPVQGG